MISASSHGATVDALIRTAQRLKEEQPMTLPIVERLRELDLDTSIDYDAPRVAADTIEELVAELTRAASVLERFRQGRYTGGELTLALDGSNALLTKIGAGQ